jgi:hypothetical protein
MWRTCDAPCVVVVQPFAGRKLPEMRDRRVILAVIGYALITRALTLAGGQRELNSYQFRVMSTEAHVLAFRAG